MFHISVMSESGIPAYVKQDRRIKGLSVLGSLFIIIVICRFVCNSSPKGELLLLSAKA